ncbi:hypothetical protein BDN67DRAFT_918076 [Paxillus ammoniavirescens]|nr:hypothetical protein BDN67DRAFT_918076 [Paxillus ammoniavirescens]
MSFSRATSQFERLAISVQRSTALRTTTSKARQRTAVLPHIRKWLATAHTKSLYPSVQSINFSGDASRAPTNKLATIHSYINQVLNSLPEATPDKYALSGEEALRMLATLATSARQQDLALIERMLGSFPSLCGLQVDADVHNHILRGLMKHGNVQTMLNWLCQMHEKPGNVRPFLEHWHTFLDYCADTGQPRIIRHAMSKMAHSGRKPNNSTFRIFFRALFNSGAPVSEFYSAFDRIEGYSFRYDESLAGMLHEGFLKLNLPQQAAEVKEEFERRFSKRVVKANAMQVEWEEGLENEVERCGIASAVRLCEEFRKDGYRVTSHTLTIMLRCSRKVADLEYAEKALQMKAGLMQWSILITNAVRAGDIHGARSIYRQSQSCGVLPDAPLVQPLLTALCESAFGSANDGLIDQALDLYNDLTRAYPPSSSNPAAPKAFGRQRSDGPDAFMYGTLLRAMANSVDVQKYSTLSTDLLADMEVRGITADGHIAVASLIVMAMRCSTSFDDALTAYRKVIGKETPKAIGVKGYRWILHILSRLSFNEQRALPPIWHYFEVVKDMRRSGLEIPPHVYASLLKQLSQLAENASKEQILRLAASVRRVHDHLTLDPSITPDTLLWNQLMDAYQRVGLFVEAYRVWEMLLISETYDNASVSIILDACGYANTWPLAEQVIKKLSERSFPLNQGNWNSYVECMCRNGMLNDALKTVCLKMGKNNKDVKPNLETARLLLTFAMRTNQQDEVSMRLQRYLPELWKSLPADLTGSMIKPEEG